MAGRTKITDAEALAYHLDPRPGKIEINASTAMATQRDLSLAYSPGVAVPCEAIAADPFMVAGSDRLCTRVIQQSGRRTLVKTGADGVYTAALQEKGLGVALKIDDGNGEAAQVAILSILRYLGGLHSDELQQLDDCCRKAIVNTRGVTTGYRQAVSL